MENWQEMNSYSKHEIEFRSCWRIIRPTDSETNMNVFYMHRNAENLYMYIVLPILQNTLKLEGRVEYGGECWIAIIKDKRVMEIRLILPQVVYLL